MTNDSDDNDVVQVCIEKVAQVCIEKVWFRMVGVTIFQVSMVQIRSQTQPDAASRSQTQPQPGGASLH